MADPEVNRSLDYLARKMATAVVDPSLRDTLHGAIKKRFDGDTNALWSSLANDPTFSAKVAEDRQERDEIAFEAAAIPRLQVAVPANFDSWDAANYAPLVAYMPQGVDDTKLTTITAYDSDGSAVQLDAQVAPKLPVIVLSLNERTDEEGNLLPSRVTSPSRSQPSQTLLTAAAVVPAYSVDVIAVALIDDNEPWSAGDAEISLKAKSRGCSGTEYLETNWPGLNNDGDAWGPIGGRDLGQTRCDVVFYWWEDDGGDFDFSLSFGNFGLGVGMDNGDDLIGGRQFAYSSFQGSTSQQHGWADLSQITQ
ncbi:MAG: DUF3103 family protein [Nocardioides sp.]